MLQWLTIDRSSLPLRKHYRTNSAQSPRRSPTQLRRDRRQDDRQLLRQQPAAVSDEIYNAKNSNGSERKTKGHRRADTAPLLAKQSAVDEDQNNAKHFRVANVGAGGTLYLQPTRVPVQVPNLAYIPATPSVTSDGASSGRSARRLLRQSDLSGTWTSRPPTRSRSVSMAGTPAPLLTLANIEQRRQTRSHSCSTVSDRTRVTKPDASELPPLPNSDYQEPPKPRGRNSTELTQGLSDVHIPHYRLGTPRFSDRGTAYLHYSIYTNSTDATPMSVLSRAEYEKLFPVPPERNVRSFYSRKSRARSLLHPSGVRGTTSRPSIPSARPWIADTMTPALFDKLERNLDDPAVVHHHPTSGAIVAATPARLIAQITSPQFLDYELLADFFLTFRCFMPGQDVLEFLLARMRWAFQSGNDAGRIARVRTFVALRHWILNYFADDFLPDRRFRQSFCDLVNDMTLDLRRRPDCGSGDINIVGELKKCWRRTCALYWPVPDAHESSPDADIVPGDEHDSRQNAFAGLQPERSESGVSFPLTVRRTTRSHSIFEMTQIQLPGRPDPQRGLPGGDNCATYGLGQPSTIMARTASIPASPISEESLEVLSCSVPFLRNIRPTARPRERARGVERPVRPPAIRTQAKLTKPAVKKPGHSHKRSGSFSDALRDARTPLSSSKVDNVELKDLPTFAFTGGLVRGILLQPSAAQVNNTVPVTPGAAGPPAPELTEARLAANDSGFGHGPHHNAGVKKFVGEVRRALSSRKGGSESPSRSLGSASSGSESRMRRRRAPRKPQPDWQQLPEPSRLDVLGLSIESSYQDAVQQTREMSKADLKLVESEPQTRSFPQMEPCDTLPSDEALPGSPRSDTPRAAMPEDGEFTVDGVHDSVRVVDFGRLNSHVTTGSQSIVIMNDTRASQVPMIPDTIRTPSAISSDMMPTPLFRDRSDFPSVSQLPRDTPAGQTPQLAQDSVEHEDRLRLSEDGLRDFLAVPNTWSFNAWSSRANSQANSQMSNRPRRSSCLVRSTTFELPPIHHQLRRRPGGDLKEVDHVHELYPLPRPKLHNKSLSEGTLAMAPRSRTGSAMKPLGDSAFTRSMRERSVSLIELHSSQPILRASFVGEAERLKRLPDSDNLGGVEATLLKLEGKIPSPSESTFAAAESRVGNSEDNPPPHSQDLPFSMEPVPRLSDSRNGHLQTHFPNLPLNIMPPSGSQSKNPPGTGFQGASIHTASESGIPSMSSNGGFPLPPAPSLPHETSVMEPQSVYDVTDANVSRYSFIDPYERMGASTPESFTYEQKPESPHYPSFGPLPWLDNPQSSFLLDDGQSLSDISTDIASSHEDGVRSFYFDDTPDDEVAPIQPFQPFQIPQTPASPFETPINDDSDRRQFPRRLPRDPDRPLKEAISAPRLLPQTANQPFPRRPYQSTKPMNTGVAGGTRAFPAHLPFLLAYESEVIAEQLTIIEKDALDEVDWKDLISLNWQQNPPDIRNWVEYLKRENPNGIDIVIARFNLVVKWCISEIVLTEVASERARTITKFIHIAAHCHRLHNYASMYQIVLALLSIDLSRLYGTWSLVAFRERQMLDHLEQLCQPIRNFHNLRAEMETAMPGNGIIPFIGLYTHDLMFNALKSPRINSVQAGNEPLVNFERYQTAATIVKNLLRLIEASSKYEFHPEPEVLSRCLWIAALDEHEIATRSKALEQI